MAIAMNYESDLHSEELFVTDLRRRVKAGDPDIPRSDFERYSSLVGTGHLLWDQWEKAKAERARRELIAECTADPDGDTGTLEILRRTNRLLAAILERLP